MTAEPDWDIFLVGAHGPEQTVQYALTAERAGLDGVWLAEHHFGAACEPKQGHGGAACEPKQGHGGAACEPKQGHGGAACEPKRNHGGSYGKVPSATVLAAHVLGCTRHIAVGTAACVLSARHPVALGEEAALLDAIAPGRFRLGVARGGPWLELEVFGTGLDRYRRGFTEALDLLIRWLSGEPCVGAAGEWFAFREVAVVPRPERPVPIWVAATSAPTVEVAAARGLPLLLGVHDDEAAKVAKLEQYARTAAAHGHDPAAVPHGSVHLGYTGEAAALRPRLASWLATTRQYVRLDGTVPERDLDAYVEHLLRIHPPGAPDLGRLANLGVRHALLMVEAAGPDTAAQIAALGAIRAPRAAPTGRRDGRT